MRAHWRRLGHDGKVREYLVRAEDGQFLVIPSADLGEALHPPGRSCHPVEGPGDYRYRCGEAEVSVSFEDPGVQLTIDGALDDQEADTLVGSIVEQMVASTRRRLFTVDL